MGTDQLKIITESDSRMIFVRMGGGWNWLSIVSMKYAANGVESLGFSYLIRSWFLNIVYDGVS
jgi:hypothetical protein